MATVAISRTADPSGVSASSNIATYTGVSTGTASADRIIVLVVTAELASASPDSATVDYGSGAVAMTAITGTGNFGAVYARIFYAKVPTGTAADFAVTFGANPTNVQNHVSVYAVTGAALAPTSGVNGSTDMDATSPLTTGAITIATGGGFIAVAAGATDASGKTWANATEDLDVDAGNFQHTTATRTTAGTVTVTCTGLNNNEDGALAYIIFKPGFFINADAGSYAVTGTDATTRLTTTKTVFPAYATLESLDAIANLDSLPLSLDYYDGVPFTVTGTAATLTKAGAAKTIAANTGSYAVTGTAAALKHGWKVTADFGTYSVTGTAATLKHGWLASAGAGSYTITGTAASLEYGRNVLATAGSYTITGTAAALKQSRALSANPGTYTITGSSVSLVMLGNTNLLVDPGSYAVTGTAASLEYGRQFAVDPGSYAVTGTDATLTKAAARALSADAGAYDLTGSPATLTYTPARGQITPQPRYGGGGAPIWSEVSWAKKKKKPKTETLVKQVAAVVEQAVPQASPEDSRLVALRLVQQMTFLQLQQIASLDAFIARVEAELAEIDDEDVLLLAA